MIADKSLLAGDVAIELVIEYATLLGQQNSADDVDLRVIDTSGDEVVATFLLNGGTAMVAETTGSVLREPDNAEAEQYLRARIARLRGLDEVSPEDIAGSDIWNAPRSA